MRDYVLIYVNGRRLEVRGDAVFSTLADYLRNDRRLTGTKVVCAEGDCGSCSVLIGRPVDGAMRYRPVTSCIQFVYQLDGAHVITVEGLKYGPDELNPVQEAFVRCHGAQCGFCTPGFVVTTYAALECQKPAGTEALTRALVGNLCRCTGYESILTAGREVDPKTVKPIEQLYPSAELLADSARAGGDAVEVRTAERTLYKPATAEDAARFRQANPDCVIVTGATDVGVQVNKGIRDPKTVLYAGGIAELSQLTVEPDRLVVGAGVTLTELEGTCRREIPELARMLTYFGSPLIKNAGTLAGNLANASPIGDTLPGLMVLNAEVELTGPAGRRWVNLNDFYVAYRKTAMRPDELITRVAIPRPKPDEVFRLYKVSKRKDLDISSFTAAVWMRLNGRLIDSVRVAFGGVGPVVLRLPNTEAYLTNQLFSGAAFAEAGKIAAGEITPLSDVRGSREYRTLLGTNILRKFHAELVAAGGDGNGKGGH